MGATLPLAVAPDGHGMVIPALLNHHALAMVVDTGAEMTTLNPGATGLDGNHELGTLIGGAYLGGPKKAELMDFRGHLYSLMYSQQLFQLPGLQARLEALTAENDTSFRDVGADGTLGMSSIAAFDVDFDLSGKQLRLFEAEGTCDRPLVNLTGSGLHEVKIEHKNGGNAVLMDVTIHGQTLRARLDTLTTQTVIYGDAARRLGLAADGPAVTAWVDGGKLAAVDPGAIRLRVGSLVLTDVPVVIARRRLGAADMVLGTDFLRRVHVWLSDSAQAVVLQYPPLPSPALQ
jgi:predicted aspartyl protease